MAFLHNAQGESPMRRRRDSKIILEKMRADAMNHEPPQKTIVTRDDRIEQAIKQMTPRDQQDILSRNMDHTAARPTGLHVHPANTRIRNNVFPPPKPDTPPRLRIRPGVSDEDLRKIWAEDDKKDQVQRKMMEATMMVDRMRKTDYPVPRPPSPVESRKKTSGLPRDPVGDESSPAGFAGMGKYSAVPTRKGKQCNPPPAPAPGRDSGRRRTGLPENDWVLGHGKRAEFEAANPKPEPRNIIEHVY